MTMIIAGRFIRQDAAAASMAQLVQSGFDPARMTSFFVNPAGQHDTFPIGGDVDESPGTEKAGAGADGRRGWAFALTRGGRLIWG